MSKTIRDLKIPGLNPDISPKAAWEQMNSLLGKRVITIHAMYAYPNWHDPRIFERQRVDRYILTPEEVVQQMSPLTLGPKTFANPDPRGNHSLAALLTSSRGVPQLRKDGDKFYDDMPRYWLARPVKFEEEAEVHVWIREVELLGDYPGSSNEGRIPTQIIGIFENIPVVYYHSHSMAHSGKNNSLLLKRMEEVGMKVPK